MDLSSHSWAALIAQWFRTVAMRTWCDEFKFHFSFFNGCYLLDVISLHVVLMCMVHQVYVFSLQLY